MSSKQYFDKDKKPICFTRLSKSIGISRWALYLRYSKGDRGVWLRRPYRYEYKTIDVNGRATTLKELARELGQSCETIYLKWKKGLLRKENNNE